MTGAGHGNTFQDNFGNFWNTGTPWIAVNFDFERRIAMFPAGFDRDGLLYSNTRFGDFPQFSPDAQVGRQRRAFYRLDAAVLSQALRVLFRPQSVFGRQRHRRKPAHILAGELKQSGRMADD